MFSSSRISRDNPQFTTSNPNFLMEKRMDTMFEDGLCRLGHYYDDNLEILKLEILCRDYITMY